LVIRRQVSREHVTSKKIFIIVLVQQIMDSWDSNVLDAVVKDRFEFLNDALRPSVNMPMSNKIANAAEVLARLEQVERMLNLSFQQTVASKSKEAASHLAEKLENLKIEASRIQGKIWDCGKEVQECNDKNAHILEELLALHREKVELTVLQKRFDDEEEWRTLVEEVDGIFSAGQLASMTDHVLKMHQFVSRSGMDEQDHKRQSYLDSLKDQLISAITPNVIAAFHQRAVESCHDYAGIFKSLGRDKDFESIFFSYIKRDFGKIWSSISWNEIDIADLLKRLLDLLVNAWQDSCRLVGPVLSNADDLICAALSESFPILQPSLESLLENYHFNDTAQQCTTKLLLNLKSMLEQTANSVSLYFGDAKQETKFQLGKKLLAEFVPLLIRYKQDETSYLLFEVNKFEFERTAWTTSAPAMFTLLSEASERSRILLGKFSLPLLVRSIEPALLNYTAKIDQLFDQLDNKTNKHFDIWLKLFSFCGKLWHLTFKLEDTLKADWQRMITDDHRQDKSLYELVIEESGYFLEENKKLMNNIVVESVLLAQLLPEYERRLRQLTSRALNIACVKLFEPVDRILNPVAKLPVWMEEQTFDLPNYSLVPQEYVTALGQYLMTLANKLEPLLNSDVGSEMALSLKWQMGKFDNMRQVKSFDPESEARLWLEWIFGEIVTRFVRTVQQVPKFALNGRKQLIVDAECLCNVIEDFGVDVPDKLNDFIGKLRDEITYS
ncbi:Conserved oligomeric Golgi complex subunit 7, partial [Trichinella sp. T9]